MAAPRLLCASRTRVVGQRCRQSLRERTHYRGTDTRDAVPRRCIYLTGRTPLNGRMPTLRFGTSSNAPIPLPFARRNDIGARPRNEWPRRSAYRKQLSWQHNGANGHGRRRAGEGFARWVLRLDAGKSELARTSTPSSTSRIWRCQFVVDGAALLRWLRLRLERKLLIAALRIVV